MVRSMTSCLAGVAERTSRAAGVSGMGLLLESGWFGVGGEMGLEPVEAVGPLGVGGAQPVVGGEQTFQSQPRRPALAVPAASDQAGLLQDRGVLGDGGRGERG